MGIPSTEVLFLMIQGILQRIQESSFIFVWRGDNLWIYGHNEKRDKNRQRPDYSPGFAVQ